jgi:hypothetical protein
MAVFQLVQGSYNPFRASKAGNYMKLQEEKNQYSNWRSSLQAYINKYRKHMAFVDKIMSYLTL